LRSRKRFDFGSVLNRKKIKKKLQINLPGLKKGLYVCIRLEKSPEGFKAKKKVH
jgi:hypothetical protein